MPKLVGTNNVTLRRKLKKADGSEFYEIPAIGDGNCAFNAFALGLIGAIKRGHHIDDDVLKAFIQLIQQDTNLAILKQRIVLYHNQHSTVTGNPYTDLADNFEQFVRRVSPGNVFTPQNFIEYVQSQNSRIEIAALHVALAPALRELSLNLREVDGATSGATASLRQDSVFAGDLELEALGKAFGFNIDICQKDSANTVKSQASHVDVVPGNQTMYVFHTGNHWNLLVTPEQKAPFANLPDLTVEPKPSASNAPLKALDSSSKISEWLTVKSKPSSTESKPSAKPKTTEEISAEKADKFRRANELMCKLDASHLMFGEFFDKLSKAVENNDNAEFNSAEKLVNACNQLPKSKL